jgi:hypothetical protein
MGETMKIDTANRYGMITVTNFKKIAKRCELPTEYIKGPVCVFAWNDGQGFSVIDKRNPDEFFAWQVKTGDKFLESAWNSLIWPTIEEAGMALTDLMKQKGWKLGHEIQKTYET